jgi:hypothetical protein
MSDFWQRRKALVQKEQLAEQQAVEAQLARQEEARLAEKTDEELLADAGLPEPEVLDSPEGVREFLQSALPQRLKTRALRRLWQLNPIFAQLDGLVDYGEDFTDSARVIENMQTAYVVGKGMLTRFDKALADADDAGLTGATQAENLAESVAENADDHEVAEAGAGLGPVAGTDTKEPQPDLAGDGPATPQPAPLAAYDDSADDAPVALPATMRRMRFHFET